MQQLADDHMKTMTEGDTETIGLISSEESPFKDVGSATSKATISGAHVKEFWTNPKNGETFALMLLDKDKVLESTKRELLQRGRESRLYGEQNLEKALQRLDQRIRQEYESPVTGTVGRQ